MGPGFRHRILTLPSALAAGVMGVSYSNIIVVFN